MKRFPRIERLPPYVFNITAELKMAARRRGEDIIDMSMGNPDGATPAHIVEKLVEASERPTTHGYSVSKGIPRLRKAIADWYERRYQVAIDPDSEAIVTIGSKEGLAHLMLATLDAGDTVLVPNPSYPIHIYGAVIAGANIRSVRMTPGVDFFEELERAVRESIPKPKMMILGFPSNPTAQCVDLPFFERVIKLAREHDIIVVHDLAYADICFDGYQAPSIMQVEGAREVAVEFFTMSKSYNMTGWRLGFVAGSARVVQAYAEVKDNMDSGQSGSSVPTALQELPRPTMRLSRGTFSGSWAVGESKAVSLISSTPQTVAVTNYCVGITQRSSATAALNVIFGNVMGTTSVVEIQPHRDTTTCVMTIAGVDLTQLPGYSAGTIQLLGHSAADTTTNATACATLTWYSITTCAAT
jgi:aspartate/methionine/tyrosine aminotransferase